MNRGRLKPAAFQAEASKPADGRSGGGGGWQEDFCGRAAVLKLIHLARFTLYLPEPARALKGMMCDPTCT